MGVKRPLFVSYAFVMSDGSIGHGWRVLVWEGKLQDGNDVMALAERVEEIANTQVGGAVSGVSLLCWRRLEEV